MTIKNFYRSLAAILFSAAFLTSCIDSDKQTGSSLLPGDHIINVTSEIFDLPVQMKMSDSLQSVFTGALIVGSYKDPDFGTVETSTAFQLIPTNPSMEFGDNPEAISFRMYMSIPNKTFFYDEDQFVPQNFYVHELIKDLDSSVVYNNSLDESFYSPQPLNTSGNVYFGGDSLIIDLSLEYAQKFLSASLSESDSTHLFIKRYKGLYMTTDPLPGSLTGGRINILEPTNIYFMMKYRYRDYENNIDKDTLITYYVSDMTMSVNKYKHSSEHLEHPAPQDLIYLEGLAGIKPYIDFNQVKERIEQWANNTNTDLSRIIIAKAEIRFPFEYPDDFTRLNHYPSQLFLFTRVNDATGNDPTIIYNPLDDLGFYDSNGAINRSLKHYSMDISTYLQRVLDGRFTGKSLQTYVAPVMRTTDYYSGEVNYYIQNIQYSKAVFNGNGAPRNPVLVLTYALMP